MQRCRSTVQWSLLGSSCMTTTVYVRTRPNLVLQPCHTSHTCLSGPEGREGTQGGKPREQGNTWKDGWMDRWIEQLVLPRPGTTSTFPLLPSCKKNFDRVKVQFLRREKGYRAKIKIPF